MRCPLHQTELVCLSCLGSKGGRAGGSARTSAKLAAARRNIAKAIEARAKGTAAKKPQPVSASERKRADLWTIEDCRDYFQSHPGRDVRASDLIDAAPPKKRLSARRYAAQRLFDLCREGGIVRVGRGVYRAKIA